MAWYVDTSAFLKLVVMEEHSPEMHAWARHQEGSGAGLWSSDLLRTEALRTARRRDADVLVAARERLDAFHLVTLTRETFLRAAELDPAILRSLDALHLAAALEFSDDLDGVVTYDDRMAEATRVLGLALLAP